MYICNCNALNDRQVKEAIDAGAKTWTEVHAHFGMSPECGSCGDEISELISPDQPGAVSVFTKDALADV